MMDSFKYENEGDGLYRVTHPRRLPDNPHYVVIAWGCMRCRFMEEYYELVGEHCYAEHGVLEIASFTYRKRWWLWRLFFGPEELIIQCDQCLEILTERAGHFCKKGVLT